VGDCTLGSESALGMSKDRREVSFLKEDKKGSVVGWAQGETGRGTPARGTKIQGWQRGKKQLEKAPKAGRERSKIKRTR